MDRKLFFLKVSFPIPPPLQKNESKSSFIGFRRVQWSCLIYFGILRRRRHFTSKGYAESLLALRKNLVNPL